MHALSTGSWVTDGGLETDLLFNHGTDLPEFAAFPLVDDDTGSALLEAYYTQYAAIAAQAGAGLLLETPTWRANPDWATKVGYDAAALDRANRAAVDLVRRVADRAEADRVLVSGILGPRGDGYIAGGADPDEAAEYHSGQVASFREAGVDLVHVMTMNEPAEAIGVARAARAEGLPVAISFTVETDGRLPDGTTLRDAVAQVDEAAAADWYGVNCAHPTHLEPALDGGEWQDRVVFLRPNASTMSHAELDEMEELDAGDLSLLLATAADVRKQVPSVRVVGGCCGTDSRHVAALWGVSAAAGL
jgi:S-methylmethionine-dependent homocysteine/selenocysteine methylase